MHTWRVFVEWEEAGVSYAHVQGKFLTSDAAERYLEDALHERPGCNAYVEYWWAGKADDDAPGTPRTEPKRPAKPERDEWSDQAMRKTLDWARADR